MKLGLAVLCALLVLNSASHVEAGGFYLLPRGARGLSRGGALVAGSEDPGSLWYNPAGLAFSGKQLLFDLILPIERVDFTRINSGGETEQKVTMRSKPLPPPGLAYSDNLGLRDFTFGIGMFAPPSALLSYPQGVRNHQTGEVEPPPQGYSALGMEGSALVFFDAGLAYRPLSWLSLGGKVSMLAGRFRARVLTFLADGGSMGQPESAEYTRPTKFGTELLFRPTGGLGTVIALDQIPHSKLPIRLGLSYQFPVSVEGAGTFDISLPDTGLYRDAELSSNEVQIRLPFPWTLRAGIEARPTDRTRIEVSYTREGWSVQDAIHVESDIRINNVPVLKEYVVGDIDVQRKLRDSWSLALGAEHTLRKNIVLRAGTFYERGSMTRSTMSVLTPDPNKLGVSLGAGYALWEGVWIDGVVGHLFMQNLNVPQGTSRIYRLEALRPALAPCSDEQGVGAGCAVPLGDGRYDIEASYVGAGLRWELAP